MKRFLVSFWSKILFRKAEHFRFEFLCDCISICNVCIFLFIYIFLFLFNPVSRFFTSDVKYLHRILINRIRAGLFSSHSIYMYTCSHLRFTVRYLVDSNQKLQTGSKQNVKKYHCDYKRIWTHILRYGTPIEHGEMVELLAKFPAK